MRTPLPTDEATADNNLQQGATPATAVTRTGGFLATVTTAGEQQTVASSMTSLPSTSRIMQSRSRASVMAAAAAAAAAASWRTKYFEVAREFVMLAEEHTALQRSTVQRPAPSGAPAAAVPARHLSRTIPTSPVREAGVEGHDTYLHHLSNPSRAQPAYIQRSASAASVATADDPRAAAEPAAEPATPGEATAAKQPALHPLESQHSPRTRRVVVHHTAPLQGRAAPTSSKPRPRSSYGFFAQRPVSGKGTKQRQKQQQQAPQVSLSVPAATRRRPRVGPATPTPVLSPSPNTTKLELFRLSMDSTSAAAVVRRSIGEQGAAASRAAAQLRARDPLTARPRSSQGRRRGARLKGKAAATHAHPAAQVGLGVRRDASDDRMAERLAAASQAARRAGIGSIGNVGGIKKNAVEPPVVAPTVTVTLPTPSRVPPTPTNEGQGQEENATQ